MINLSNGAIVVSAGIGAAATRSTRIFLADFEGQPTGAFTDFPAALDYARSSTMNAPTSDGQAYVMGISADEGAIADWYGVRGMLHTRGYTNKIAAPRNPATWSAATGGSSSTGGQAGSPDGTSNAIHHVVVSGFAGKYPTYAISLGVTYTSWCLAKPNGGSACQINQFDSAGHGAPFTLSAGWNLVYKTITSPINGTGGFIPADGRNNGGGTVNTALDYDTDMHVEAAVPYALPYHDTTLAPSVYSTLIDGWGRFRFRVSVAWLCGSAQLADNPVLWYLDPLNYCEIDKTMLTIRVVVDGFPIRLSLSEVGLATWTAGETHDFIIDAGNGAPRGSVSINGASRVSFDATTQRHGPIWSEGFPLYLLSKSGTSQHADVIVRQMGVWGLSRSPSTTKLWTAPGASGDGLTRATPSDLSTALGLAASALGSGQRVRVYVTASGTYDVGAGLDWTDGSLSGLVLAPLPGVSYTFSGAVDATTGWTVDSGSRYKRAFPAGTSGRLQLTANGTRATLASSTISSGGIAGWSRTPTGFTAADATIAGYAHPDEVEIITRGTSATWKQGYLTVTGAVGTAITIDATDLAAADWQIGYELNLAVGYRGVKELVAAGTFAAEQATSTLYYQFRGGETPNTTTVRVANTSHIITIANSTNITIVGATIADTKWDRATTSRSGDAYPYGGGGGGGFIPLQDGVTGGPNGDYWTIPAAATVRRSTNIWFQGCTFTRLAGDGLAFETAAQSSGHRGCVFTDVDGHRVRAGFVMPEDQRPATDADVVSDIWNWSSSANGTGSGFPGCAHFAHYFVRRRRTHYCVSTNAAWSGFTFGWGWSYADPGGGGWPAGYTTDPTTPTVNADGEVAFCRATGSGAILIDSGCFYYNGAQNVSTTRNSYSVSGGATRGFYIDNGGSQETNTDCVSQSTFYAQFGTPVAHNNVLTNSISTGVTVGYGINSNVSTNHTIATYPFTSPTAVSIVNLANLA